MPEMPSILMSGIAINPVEHRLEFPPAPFAVDVVERIPKGSGEVVEDIFHWIEQYPFSVLMQLV